MSNVQEDATPEELQEMLREQKEHSQKLQQQVETMRLRNQLEAEKMQQAQWETALEQLKETREQIAQQHEENIRKMRSMAQETVSTRTSQPLNWLQEELTKTNPLAPSSLDEDRHKADRLEELHRQQEELQKEIASLTGREYSATPGNPSTKNTDQELLLEQLKAALAPQEGDKDPNKALLKALITSSNKVQGASGTSTLRPDVLSKLAGDMEFSMAEWLASLNKQEEGESEISKLLGKLDDESDCRAECRHTKMKSGMLDKSTTNIRHKEVWPQKNLGEDWAEEEIEFKQLRFEHLVAGETRTIETCSDPAQILGRLRLLRRIAYLKLRGIEWQLLRKMYAAILSSIETREYSWESNLDRFESILYHKVLADRSLEKEVSRDCRPQEGCKRFCRDYNKPEGCPKNAPHPVWFGTGPGATKKMVYHCCTACLIREKVQRTPRRPHGLSSAGLTTLRLTKANGGI